MRLDVQRGKGGRRARNEAIYFRLDRRGGGRGTERGGGSDGEGGGRVEGKGKWWQGDA